MRKGQPAALDLRTVFEAAYSARDEVPDLFALWMAEAYAPYMSTRTEDGPWHYNASEISNCVRQGVFARQGVERESFSVESLNTFEIGKQFHVLIQFGLAVHPEYTLLGHEVGGFDPASQVSAKADAVYEHKDTRYIIEVKTESKFSPAKRRKDAKAEGRTSTAKPAHAYQLMASAVVINALHPALAPHQGYIVYVDKETGDVDQQPVDLDADLVDSLVTEREEAWFDAVLGTLPPRLASFPNGLCRARSASDPRGAYCPFREHCIKEPA